MATLITEAEFETADRVSPFDRAQANADAFGMSLLTCLTVSTIATGIDESIDARREAMKNGHSAQVTFMNGVIKELEASLTEPALFDLSTSGIS